MWIYNTWEGTIFPGCMLWGWGYEPLAAKVPETGSTSVAQLWTWLLGFTLFWACYLFICLFVCLFVWLGRVLVEACWIFVAAYGILVTACGIFSCGMRTLTCSMWDLVPWPGIEPGPSALGAWSLSHWTTREVSVLSFSWEESWCLRHGFPRFWITNSHGATRHSLVIRAHKLLRFPVSIWELPSSMVLRMYLHFFLLRHHGLCSPNYTTSLETLALEGTSNTTFHISTPWGHLCYGWTLLGHSCHSYLWVHGLLLLNL